MDQELITLESEIHYPVLLIPKKCTTLETESEPNENVFIDLNITSVDVDGNITCIYSGFCNVKVLDPPQSQALDDSMDYVSENTQNAVTITDPNATFNQSQVWIDPDRSPNVYNHYNLNPQANYSIQSQTKSRSVTVEKHCTYITRNVYNYEEAIRYTPVEQYEHKKFKKINVNEQQHCQNSFDQNNMSLYQDYEFECGVFLSQLPDEIINEKENKVREERKFIERDSPNDALKQLMSPGIQSSSKQTKTILFLGHDAHSGQTIQKIAVNDPMLECSGSHDEVGEVMECQPDPNHKKYQCEKCKQIFDQLSTFKQHMIGNHNPRSPKDKDLDELQSPYPSSEVKFFCTECGKTLKSQDKFMEHCQRHGNPELECQKCHKVFASKFTLRTHLQVHTRMFPCDFCPKSFSNIQDFKIHISRIHFMYTCDYCDLYFDKLVNLDAHLLTHTDIKTFEEAGKTELPESLLDETLSENDLINTEPLLDSDVAKLSPEDVMENANSVLAKVMSNKIFLLHCKKARRHRKTEKACDVCRKRFDRVGDLKRHLIEHVIRCSLAKTPVSDNGVLNIQCEVCQVESFTKIDKYKAHLREHAKLTLYKCTFCDKSFSDSSNFSKHKKIHGDSYFQCDLCKRKFNSKKMITQHMEYHNENEPITCEYCDKVFYFDSMLNKHIKCAHTKEFSTSFRCRFCHQYFKSLRFKWDHEWSIHNVRKMIVDCLICGSKYRKYSELKKHCAKAHDLDIPPAKKLLRNKSH